MGVYIKGMEMPKGLGKTITIYPNGTVRVWVNNKGRGELLEQRAVPVPLHGRLIDTDAVSLEGGPYEYDEWCKWALEQYQDAPTIIPADKGEPE